MKIHVTRDGYRISEHIDIGDGSPETFKMFYDALRIIYPNGIVQYSPDKEKKWPFMVQSIKK